MSEDAKSGRAQAERAAEYKLLVEDLRDLQVQDERLDSALAAWVRALERRAEAWEKLGISLATDDDGVLAEAESLYT